jgi:hypothetical protein
MHGGRRGNYPIFPAAIQSTSNELLKNPDDRTIAGKSHQPQLADASYSAYKRNCGSLIPNPTNAVGGFFILGLQEELRIAHPKSHQRSWWILHIQP